MKSLSLILRILAIVAACAAVALFFMSKGKLAEKQTQLEAAQAATVETQGELDGANTQITSLEGQLTTERKSLADTKGKLESVRSEMYTAKQEVTRTQQQLKESKNTVAELEDTTTRLRADLVKTEKSLAMASKEGEIAELNERIAELTKSNDTLQQEVLAAEALQRSSAAARTATVNQSNAGTGAYNSTFKPNSAPAAKPASIGTATTVASISTSNGILILDSTPELGLAAGAQITLIQDLTALGKVQITQVTDTLAVANILPGADFKKLAQGDSVKILH